MRRRDLDVTGGERRPRDVWRARWGVPCREHAHGKTEVAVPNWRAHSWLGIELGKRLVGGVLQRRHACVLSARHGWLAAVEVAQARGIDHARLLPGDFSRPGFRNDQSGE